MVQNPTDRIVFDHLNRSKTIAIFGMSNREDRTSYQIARELQRSGYRIIPINPKLKGSELLGEQVFGSLQEVTVEVDIVDIFRRSHFLPEVAVDFLTMKNAKQAVFWAQSGLVSEDAFNLLKKSGVPEENIIMDKCIKIELLRKSWEANGSV